MDAECESVAQCLTDFMSQILSDTERSPTPCEVCEPKTPIGHSTMGMFPLILLPGYGHPGFGKIPYVPFNRAPIA